MGCRGLSLPLELSKVRPKADGTGTLSPAAIPSARLPSPSDYSYRTLSPVMRQAGRPVLAARGEAEGGGQMAVRLTGANGGQRLPAAGLRPAMHSPPSVGGTAPGYSREHAAAFTAF